MIQCENGHQLNPKEEEDKNENIKKPNISLTLDLNIIEESEENTKYKEEEHLSEEESLGYNSNYNLFQNNTSNKENNILKEKTSKRKASTLSTAISQTDTFSETNSFLPPNNLKNLNYERKSSYTQPSLVFFGRERLNSTPITNYYEGLDHYIRGLHPDKNEYQKSNNYIEKETFFKQKNFPLNNKFKSFDLAEQKKFNSNQILKNIEDNFKITPNNKLASSFQFDNNMQNNIQNNINNNQNNLATLTPKFNNCIYGKFDMPMYYLGYYNIDCKYFFNFNILFSIEWIINDAK